MTDIAPGVVGVGFAEARRAADAADQGRLAAEAVVGEVLAQGAVVDPGQLAHRAAPGEVVDALAGAQVIRVVGERRRDVVAAALKAAAGQVPVRVVSEGERPAGRAAEGERGGQDGVPRERKVLVLCRAGSIGVHRRRAICGSDIADGAVVARGVDRRHAAAGVAADRELVPGCLIVRGHLALRVARGRLCRAVGRGVPGEVAEAVDAEGVGGAGGLDDAGERVLTVIGEAVYASSPSVTVVRSAPS